MAISVVCVRRARVCRRCVDGASNGHLSGVCSAPTTLRARQLPGADTGYHRHCRRRRTHCLRQELVAYIKLCKLLSLTYKALTTAQPTYLYSLISVQPLVLLAPHLLSPFLDHLHILL